jgi:pimeloyl-ACP methyl ester carboxylesterase
MAITSIEKSTIVRAHQKAVWVGFRAAEHVAPALGARAAERVWFRLPPRPSASRFPLPDGGEPFEVVSDGSTIRGKHWGEGPVIYLVHGWGGWAAQLRDYVWPLVDRGYRVVAFDAPSHGTSDPGPTGPGTSNAIEFGRALDSVAARFGPAYAVIAHSMGAIATLLALEHGWLSTQRLVFIAPMSTLYETLQSFGRMLGFGPRTLRRLGRRMHGRFGLPISHFDVRRLSEPLRDSTPLLVVHDRLDADTPYAASEAVVADWPHARLVATHGLGHNRVMRDAEVLRSVVRFVTERDRVAVGA